MKIETEKDSDLHLRINANDYLLLKTLSASCGKSVSTYVNPEKYQYNSADIISDDINYYEKICIVGDKVDGDNKAEMIINDLLRGVSPRIMVSRYGRDFVIHMKQYQECVNEIRYYEADEHIRQKILADENANKIENELLQCPFDD